MNRQDWVALIVILVLVVAGVGYSIYEARVVTCDEWLADLEEWERDGGVATIGDFPSGDRPEISQERFEDLRARLGVLLRTQPKGCEDDPLPG